MDTRHSKGFSLSKIMNHINLDTTTPEGREVVKALIEAKSERLERRLDRGCNSDWEKMDYPSWIVGYTEHLWEYWQFRLALPDSVALANRFRTRRHRADCPTLKATVSMEEKPSHVKAREPFSLEGEISKASDSFHRGESSRINYICKALRKIVERINSLEGK